MDFRLVFEATLQPVIVTNNFEQIPFVTRDPLYEHNRLGKLTNEISSKSSL